jgi:hypothetical protein
MPNPTTITPALSEAERLINELIQAVRDAATQVSGPCGDYREEERALRALIRTLHGQPFGFSWEDVEHLRLIAGQPEALYLGINHGYVLRNLADRIAALLPPKDSTE